MFLLFSLPEQIHKALDKRQLNGPTIFRVSCAVWGTPEKESVRHHVDMLEKVGYDRQEQIKSLLIDYLKKLEGNEEQKIQKVAELFKDWDPDMKHELLRGNKAKNTFV